MMTPQEKAKSLFEKFINHTLKHDEFLHAKSCVLIACEELINCTPSIDGRPPNYQDINEHCREYWIEVKALVESYSGFKIDYKIIE